MHGYTFGCSLVQSLRKLKLLSLSDPLTFPFFHFHSTKIQHSRVGYQIMNLNNDSHFNSKYGSTSSSSSRAAMVYQVPGGLSSDEMDRIAGHTIQRYTDSHSHSRSISQRSGKGIAIVWFRNDLRVLDNEALFTAWSSSEAVLPLYCVDPRLFHTTHYFAFPKTGALRAQFLIECLADLKNNLMKLGLNLLIQHGKPEDIIPSLVKEFGAHTVYAQKETCSEEVNVERLVSCSLQQVALASPLGPSTRPTPTNNAKLQLVWGVTMYHVDDLPFDSSCLPEVYTQFRKSVESKSKIRGCIKLPSSLGPPPNIGDWGCVPSLSQLGLQEGKVNNGMRFVGGETAALSRVNEYFWKKDLLRMYKETRNGMLGPDYSTKFSPWLASGSLSPRFIYEEVKRYEKERQTNDSTYWVLFELIWRDYFRFLSIKYGNSLFHIGGPRKVKTRWSQDQLLFESWRDGCTGYPLIDANMKELSMTGFMSNRGRQIVCSFLVRDMGIDWRMGAEWFETCLLDYDPCSNYGNWTYGAGVGNDPREDRYFSIPKQALTYDPEGKYVAYWLPELQALPKEKRNFPGHLYIKQIVPLKYGNSHRNRNSDSEGKGKHMKGYKR
ncbi:cryptochrome DASH, chloroplastic/mitochondrial isoform X2 [Camellia sinensis]|uniref:cryptochrome DASH, chloroplastic/mitochondrial isoform X1 n=1 Tax=Camellia sinensis TaxID=4442 RepID=UPI001036D8F1|nr:cryptochrome DASH, chloroplastic/mitochondrial isoform X1 [Camellia sinensis]XP_028081501.1 cryptochrome DASH, chloroplastic/mitochondrial isoform X2 [Camellia sinensis]